MEKLYTFTSHLLYMAYTTSFNQVMLGLTLNPSLSQCYYDPLSQWKTHLNLITWARLQLLLLSFTEEPLSFLHPFSILLCFLAVLFSLLSRFLSPCAPITGSRQPRTTSQPKLLHTEDIQHSSVTKRTEVQKLLQAALLYPGVSNRLQASLNQFT